MPHVSSGPFERSPARPEPRPSPVLVTYVLVATYAQQSQSDGWLGSSESEERT